MIHAYNIRLAQPDEAETITEVMRRSKAYWGYDAKFMETFRQTMVIRAEQIRAHIVYVAQDQTGRVIGFYQLQQRESEMHLLDLFIEPEFIGRGIGKVLFRHAVEQSRVMGFCGFTLDSDPNAEPFYLRMGAIRIGERESAIPGRFIPKMKYTEPECEGIEQTI
jgi:GNAT superfamily N-acetyltransferase